MPRWWSESESEGNVKSSNPVTCKNPAHARQREKCNAVTNLVVVTTRNRLGCGADITMAAKAIGLDLFPVGVGRILFNDLRTKFIQDLTSVKYVRLCPLRDRFIPEIPPADVFKSEI